MRERHVMYDMDSGTEFRGCAFIARYEDRGRCILDSGSSVGKCSCQ